MEEMDGLVTALLAVVFAVAAVVVAAIATRIVTRRRRWALMRRFGPEYDRAVAQYGSVNAAERELGARQRRIQRLAIKPLSTNEHRAYSEYWHMAQERFVDDPHEAVQRAHALVEDVMRVRGYPVDDFEHEVADLSVLHPKVVQHYRAAVTLARQNWGGAADTEQLRQAMVHYRALFGDLLVEAAPKWRMFQEAHA